MPITTVSSRAVDRRPGAAKRARRQGLVIVTNRGRPAYVLLTFEAYRRLTGPAASVIDLLAMPGVEETDFDPPRAGLVTRPEPQR